MVKVLTHKTKKGFDWLIMYLRVSRNLTYLLIRSYIKVDYKNSSPYTSYVINNKSRETDKGKYLNYTS